MMSEASNKKTLRFTIFILAFMVVVMFFVFVFVIPSIKTYKSKKAEYLFQKQRFQKLEEKQKNLEDELNKLQERYSTTLKAFSNDFNESAFLAFAKKYFSNVKLKQMKKTKSESGLDIYEFRADFNANTPVMFYDFVEALKNMDSVIKINFPVVLKATNGKIDLKFNMSVYHLKR